MHIPGKRHCPNDILHLRSDLFQRGNVVTRNPDFYGGLLYRPLLQFLDNNHCLGNDSSQFHLQVGHEGRRLFYRFGVDNELAVGAIGLLGVDVVVEPRGALPDKTCVMGYFRTTGQILFDPAHGGIRCLDTRTLAHPDINHKLVAFGRREELLRYQS